MACIPFDSKIKQRASAGHSTYTLPICCCSFCLQTLQFEGTLTKSCRTENNCLQGFCKLEEVNSSSFKCTACLLWSWLHCQEVEDTYSAPAALCQVGPGAAEGLQSLRSLRSVVVFPKYVDLWHSGKDIARRTFVCRSPQENSQAVEAEPLQQKVCMWVAEPGTCMETPNFKALSKCLLIILQQPLRLSGRY